jgi:hypothetical protein
MLKLWGYIGYLHSFAILGFVVWAFSKNNNSSPDDVFVLIMLLLVFAAIVLIVYNVLVFPLLKFRTYKTMSALDEFLAQDMDVGDAILKPSGLAKVLGTLGLLALIGTLMSAAVIAYEVVESNSFGGSWRSEEVLGLLAAIIVLVTGVFEFLFTIRTINTKRIEAIADSPE